MKHRTTIVEAAVRTPKWRKIISAPFIYGMIFPSIALHISAEMYHQVCFRLYGISLLDVRNYIVIDRHKLSKLTIMEKINCMYCGYINGLYAYLVALARKTEEYWCAIKHAEGPVHTTQEQQSTFLPRNMFE